MKDNMSVVLSLSSIKYVLYALIMHLQQFIEILRGTADGCTVVKVLCYKSEGRWFDSKLCLWNFPLT
jgi:hypothetical protein